MYLTRDHAFQDMTDILTQLKTEIKATEELIRVCAGGHRKYHTGLQADWLACYVHGCHCRKPRLVLQSVNYERTRTRK